MRPEQSRLSGCLDRFSTNPLVTGASDASGGRNINGPAVMRVPAFVNKPLGRYYLYFGHHSGQFIRLALPVPAWTWLRSARPSAEWQAEGPAFNISTRVNQCILGQLPAASNKTRCRVEAVEAVTIAGPDQSSAAKCVPRKIKRRMLVCFLY